MKKIINTTERFIPEMLEGIYAAHPGELTCVNGDLHCLVNARSHEGKVSLATGGGSGHLPLFLGYVGEGHAGRLRHRRCVPIPQRRADACRYPPHPSGQGRALHLRQLQRRYL